MTFDIEIPGCPEAVLSPNAPRGISNRIKGAARARVRKSTAMAARGCPEYFAVREVLENAESISLEWNVYWSKGRKKMDKDNLIATLKGYQDGLSDAFGYNDKLIRDLDVVQDRDKSGRGLMIARISV